ncbi:MAG: hypothetical protein IPN71_20705 [Fibrobacteres bacterium]|jgi:hypothetical protein|nr:hypothetical protein [Fibrobacterota bacterium]
MAKKPVSSLLLPNISIGIGIVLLAIGSGVALGAADGLVAGLFLLGLGACFGGGGFFLRAKATQKLKLRERLLSVGTRVAADQVDVGYDSSIEINGNNPWYLVARFTVQGVTYESEGRRWWGNLEVPASVGVAYNPADPSENTIDD